MRYKKIIIVILIIILPPGLYFMYLSMQNSTLSRKWLQNPPKSGQIITVANKQEFFVSVKGIGKPVIIFETGLGSISAEWWHIQDQVSQFATTITYDRAGYGWSSEGTYPRTASAVSNELGQILQKLRLEGPYILVGHDIGGLFIQQFACKYPHRVRGMVFVDPVTHDFSLFRKNLSRPIYKNLIDKTANLKVSRFLAQLGIIRKFQAVPYTKVPDTGIKQHIVEQYSLAKSYRTMLSEYRDGLKSPKYKLAGDCGKTATIPKVVIHHSPGLFKSRLKLYKLSYDEIETVEKTWMRMHKNIIQSTKTRKNTIVTAEHAEHNIHFDQPEIIISTIKRMVRSIKK